jgi:hypothetical protein
MSQIERVAEELKKELTYHTGILFAENDPVPYHAVVTMDWDNAIDTLVNQFKNEYTQHHKRVINSEAIQWTGNNLEDVIKLIGWHDSASTKWTWEGYKQIVREKGLKIFTPIGPSMVHIGDYIVRGAGGGLYISSGQRPDEVDTELGRMLIKMANCTNRDQMFSVASSAVQEIRKRRETGE